MSLRDKINDLIFEDNDGFIEYVNTKYSTPKHYQAKVDVIDFCKGYDLNFNEGNVIKYISRCKYKDNRLDDLKKALDYVQREIKYVEGL